MENAKKQNSGLVAVGYTFVGLNLLMLPVLFMPAAIIIGLVCLGADRTKDGLIIVLLAILTGCVGASIGGWGLGLKEIPSID